jgi:hypothetical protein
MLSGNPVPSTPAERHEASSSQVELPGAVAREQRSEDAMLDIVGESKSQGTRGSLEGIEASATKIHDSEQTEESDLTEEAKDAPGMIIGYICVAID